MSAEFAEKQELLKRKSELILSKREHEMKLTAIKNLVRSSGRMPAEKYRQCCHAQNEHARAIHTIESQLVPVQLRLREIADAGFKPREGGDGGHTGHMKDVVSLLVSLRQEYQDFAEDATRVASMRRMASEFVGRLNSVIRRAVHVPEPKESNDEG